MTSTSARRPHRQPAFGEVPPGTPRSYDYRQEVPQSSSNFHAPATPEEANVPPLPGALHSPDGDAFNVDPNAPYLESGGISADAARTPPPPRGEGKRSAGGFVNLVKRAMSARQRPPSEGLLPTTAPLYSARYQSPQPPPMPDIPRSPPRVNPVNQTYVSPPNSSETAHETLETDDTHDGETTAVDHEMPPVVPELGSPVYIEPQPGSDYAKMEGAPSVSNASFASYMSRVQKFFHDINELPWVAERVTVDYIPGESRRHRAPLRPVVRPVLSWYGGRPHSGHPGPVDLFSESSSGSSSPTVVYQIQSPGGPSQNIPVAAIAPASTAPSSAYGPARVLQHNAPPPAARVRAGGTLYPNGYVPYHHQEAVAAQYPGLSHHTMQVPNMTQVPAASTASSMTGHRSTAGQYPYPTSHT